jgi:phosphopantothenoylcysteine decarboxylase/phosphopantothenate--cysteine ligase
MRNKKIILGVTGSIAAYKAVSLLRQMKAREAHVTVVMTRTAQKFISPLTFEVLSQEKVYTDLFLPSHEMAHISLAESADLILIAPATANFIAKVSAGFSDDLLSALVLASHAHIMMAPAMDGEMWQKTTTRRNVKFLTGEGVRFIWPEKGLLASGKSGKGRLAGEGAIINEISLLFEEKRDLSGKRICITAGPTVEPIDPVRFISNRSSGKMGYALARSAYKRGALVTLISGPTALPPPAGIETIFVQTGDEMAESVFKKFPESDILIMAAAVADYKVSRPAQTKIKKGDGELVLQLTPAIDILAELGKLRKNQILVGFAAETENSERYPVKKLKEKNLDLIVANNISLKGAEFGSNTNIVTVFDRHGNKEEFPVLPKEKVAENILDKIISYKP